MEATPLELVSVKTTQPTLPFPAHATRQPMVTERLIIRPMSQDDLQGLHELRTQPEVMKFTKFGVIDANIEETQAKLDLYIPPNDANTFNWTIYLKSTGEMIGCGGCHKLDGEIGWPVIGYMFKVGFWGKGFATEFALPFMDAWWKLPRSVCELKVDKSTVHVAEGEPVREIFTAVTEQSNLASQKVLGKQGFEKVKVWIEKDAQNPAGDTDVTLIVYGIPRPDE